MRRAFACVLCAGLLACGCAPARPEPGITWLQCLRPTAGPTGPDVIEMEVALIDCPLGDHFINGPLWALGDDQVVSPEKKAALDDNGFRVGQVGGIPPAELQTLLTSERSCTAPQRITLHAGSPTPVPLGEPLPACRFTLRQDDRATPVALEQARCGLVVVPSLTDDGRTRLVFTPEVRHGEPVLGPGPTQDRSGWVLQNQQPREEYPALAWEVKLAPNEFVLVGGRYDRPDTLGHLCFVRREGARPCQHLLAIRTTRTLPGVAAETDPRPADDGAVPLALQAAQPTVRGTCR